MKWPTKAQYRVLRALTTMSLDAGRIELGQLTGMSGAALEKCIDACKRNGWLNENGMANDRARAIFANWPHGDCGDAFAHLRP